MATSYRSGVSFVVVIPIKTLANAKRRLRRQFSAADTEELAFAFASDTLAAALACTGVREIMVISADARVGRMANSHGVRLIPDPGGGLNAAIRGGIAAARADSCVAVAVLAADLPALTAGHLGAALAAASGIERAVVADRSGTGTTLLTASAGISLIPAFGRGSRLRHGGLGHRALAIDCGSPLRLDVDTPDDLSAAQQLGVGPATSAHLRLIAARPHRTP